MHHLAQLEVGFGVAGPQDAVGAPERTGAQPAQRFGREVRIVDAELRIDEEDAERQVLDHVIEIAAPGREAGARGDFEGAAEMQRRLAQHRSGPFPQFGLLGRVADFERQLAGPLAQEHDAGRRIVSAEPAQPFGPEARPARLDARHHLVVVVDLVGCPPGERRQPRIFGRPGRRIVSDGLGLEPALREDEIRPRNEVVAGNEHETARETRAQDVEDRIPVRPAERHVVNGTRQRILRITHVRLRGGRPRPCSNRCLPDFPRAGPEEASMPRHRRGLSAAGWR